MGWFGGAGTLGIFAEYFLKVTIVLSLALLAAAASKRRPAAFRHFVLSFALIGLLLLPLLSLAPVGWKTSFLPARPAGMEAQARARDVGYLPLDAIEFPAGTPSMIADIPADRPSGLLPLDASIRPRESSSPSLRPGPSSRPPRDQQQHRRRGALGIAIAVLWLAGLSVLLLRLGFGLAGAVKLTAGATTLVDPIWRVLLERFLSLVSLSRKISLKSHPEVLVPLTWGWRKPVILMPAGSDTWTEEERSSALFHELSHVKRADFLIMLLVRTSLAMFWFNPLCWIVYRELRKEQEIACDELVLRAGIRPSIYAASLLAFRRSMGFRWNPSAALLGLLGRSLFHERLAAILKQKLTFKEVKMKTKIMLAAAVVSAVAIIGTARPAIGVEKKAAAATVVETATPEPGYLAATLPAAETQEKQTDKVNSQEKAKEKAKAAEKEKPAVENKIVVMAKEGKKTPIEITITEGDIVKTLILDKPLTITSGEGGRGLVLTSDGQETLILKGEPLRLEIKGRGLELIKEGKVLKVGEGGVYRFIREGDKDGSKIAWVVKEPDKGIEIKEISAKPVTGVWVADKVKPRIYWSVSEKELLGKVREIQEQVKAVKEKKLDISALEKSLEKLEAELKAGEEKSRQFGVKLKLDKEPGEFTLYKRIREDKAKGEVGVYIMEGDKSDKAWTVTVAEDDAALQFIIKGKAGQEGREAFDRAVARVKKELPEGYKLDPEYDEESGTMTFKITLPGGKKDSEELIKKLVESLREEVKK